MNGLKDRINKLKQKKYVKITTKLFFVIIALGVTLFGMTGVYFLIADFLYNY